MGRPPWPLEVAVLRELWGTFWGMIGRPRVTLDRLAQLTGIRPAVMLVTADMVIGWLNGLLFALFGYDWLGTRRELLDPTYVGFFGQLRVGTAHYVPIFNWLISPLLALLGLAVMPGLAHVLSKLWRGQGTYEQMVNTLVYAQAPSILVRSVINDVLLGGVPANLIAGHRYAFTAAMKGEFGPAASTLWWVYMIGVYIAGVDLWVVVLGTLAIRRVQRVPWWAAALVMLFVYVLWFYGIAGSVVR
jgi:hypothetical protein